MNTETEASPPRPRHSLVEPGSMCDFETCVVDRVAALFRDLMKEWRMPAAVIADEMFESLINAAAIEKVDPKLLENEELARALRRDLKMEREAQAFHAFFAEQMQDGSQFKRGQHPLGEALIRSLR